MKDPEMGERKYYTPSIKEFHIGFIFEFKHPDFNDWIEYCLDYINPEEESCPFAYRNLEGVFRVKYLDTEDIESFGFKFLGKSNRMWYKMDLDDLRKFPISNYKFQAVELSHEWMNPKEFGVMIKCQLKGDIQEDVVFEGFCRNYSELERVLKQLNIIEC